MSQMIPLNLVLASILDTFGISVTSILLHLLNLVVLTVGLYFLLFKPVKKMVQRAAGKSEKDRTGKQRTQRGSEKTERQYRGGIDRGEKGSRGYTRKGPCA